MLGAFLNAMEEAIFDSSDVHDNQKMQLLSDAKKMEVFKRIAFDVLLQRSEGG